MFAARGGFLAPKPSSGPTEPFVMIIDTTLTPGDLIFNMPLQDFGDYSVTIDWGDGNIQNVVPADSTGYPNYVPHEYATDGTYTISMTGNVSQMGGNIPQTAKDKVISIVDWGTVGWIYLDNFASEWRNLVSVPDYLPTTVINTYNMFSGTVNLNDAGISNWDMSQVTATGYMFAGSGFNQPLSSWNVSNVTDMTRMFGSYNLGTKSQFNQDIAMWDVSNVSMLLFGTSFDLMFYENEVFNQDLSSWCVAQITSTPSNFDTGAISWTLPKPNWGAPCA